jgi:nitrite reductase/ring-hydroxylating ferredoxin subunit
VSPDTGRASYRVVCPVEELPPGAMKIVPSGKFGVGVFNVNGSYRALTKYCPHEGGPLCLGYVRGTTTEDPQAPGRRRLDPRWRDHPLPWHQCEFDSLTGETLSAPARRIRTYPVDVIDGYVRRTTRPWCRACPATQLTGLHTRRLLTLRHPTKPGTPQWRPLRSSPQKPPAAPRLAAVGVSWATFATHMIGA